jgi:hypothetical protein
MKRRNFLQAALASLLGFLVPGSTPGQPAQETHWRLRNGRWLPVRVTDLRQGDVVAWTHGGQMFRAVANPYPFPDEPERVEVNEMMLWLDGAWVPVSYDCTRRVWVPTSDLPESHWSWRTF